MEASSMKKYGTRLPQLAKEVRQKISTTKLAKSDDENEATNAKRKETCLNKYGVEIASKAEIVKEHAKETFRKTFGVDHPMQNKKVKKHAAETNTARYGGASPMCSHEVRSKAKAKYQYDGVYFDSGAELAYYVWLKDNGIDFKYHPKPISYKDSNGVDRKYFPDFLVEGKLVEIKGDIWWENATEEKRNAIKRHSDKIMFKNEYLKFVEYVKKKYGRDFLKNRKRKKHV